jgi:peptidoglycan/LPS O-acetylase OafA/YrhL
MSQDRFCFIDALRGFAALAVVIFHAGAGNHIDSLPSGFLVVASYGEFGVAVFFVISGFVIAHSLRDQKLTASGVGTFMLRRAIRLDPPYWIAIALAICFSQLASALVPGRIPKEYSNDQVIAHLFYAQELLGYPEINTVFWTLCYEIQFYLIFALLLSTRSVNLMAVAFVGSLLWPLGLAPEIRGLFPNFFYGFLLGVGAYYCWRQPKARVWFALYATIILVSSLEHGNRFGVASALAAATIAVVASLGQLGTLLKWRQLQLLGLISYSLYLTHGPISGASFRVWYRLAGSSPASEALGLVVTVVACIAVAAGMYYLAERPFIALSKTWTMRLRSA